MSANDELEQVEPQEALDLYIADKERDGAASATIRSHRSRLGHFVTWFNEETDYDSLAELSGLDVRKFKLWRFDDDNSIHTVATHLDTLRVFLRFCAGIDALDPEIPPKVKSPNRPNGQRSNEITSDRAEAMLDYLDRYHYASVEHALVHLLWHAMIRVGAARSLDVDDLDLEEGYAEFSHDPSEDTPLKNDEGSERTIHLRPQTCQILADYIEQNRVDATDEHGREPLFTVEGCEGRPHVNTLRNRVYAITRPCAHGQGCPHDRDPADCEAAQTMNDASKCPSSESSHAIRRGSISWALRNETPKPVVSDRADVSPEIIDRNYSTLTDREQADVRSSQLPDDLTDE
ncbi:tyrosine-type recombinase/integrase [Natronomonas marina]|uniref:tyrosine-type recombinase/integrase n=1 Tax=Natronomonas marina TaxID=2961939 RepID=UPI0020C94A3B|nr:site-specific integrase [Natronomonas marina]